jgi:hypothetical protein
MIGRGNRSTRRKPAPVPLCPPQTPHAARTRTRAAAVGSQHLTAELWHGLALCWSPSCQEGSTVQTQAWTPLPVTWSYTCSPCETTFLAMALVASLLSRHVCPDSPQKTTTDLPTSWRLQTWQRISVTTRWSGAYARRLYKALRLGQVYFGLIYFTYAFLYEVLGSLAKIFITVIFMHVT